MKSETIPQRILIAKDGMYYTDGESIVGTVILPVDADASVWREVAEDELPKDDDTEIM